jgi:hypothetical protein
VFVLGRWEQRERWEDLTRTHLPCRHRCLTVCGKWLSSAPGFNNPDSPEHHAWQLCHRSRNKHGHMMMRPPAGGAVDTGREKQRQSSHCWSEATRTPPLQARERTTRTTARAWLTSLHNMPVIQLLYTHISLVRRSLSSSSSRPTLCASGSHCSSSLLYTTS